MLKSVTDEHFVALSKRGFVAKFFFKIEKPQKNYLWKIIFVLTFPLFSFIACSTDVVLEYDSESTLRTEAFELSRHIRWTDEIEPNRLTEKIADAEGFDKKLKSNPQNVFASGAETLYPKLYPTLSGFSQLDSGKMPLELRKQLVVFFDSLKTGAANENLIEKSNLYTLAFFLADIESFVGSGEVLQSYIFGDAFVNNNFVLCPVRLYYKQMTIDVSVVATLDSGVWKILQLDFL